MNLHFALCATVYASRIIRLWAESGESGENMEKSWRSTCVHLFKKLHTAIGPSVETSDNLKTN